MLLDIAEQILAQCAADREQAEHLRTAASGAADQLLEKADTYEEIVRDNLPTWVGLNEVSRHTGWTKRHLRDVARRIRDAADKDGQPDARKENGAWQIRTTAALELPAKDEAASAEPDDPEPAAENPTIDELATQLAA